jgi:hypothetical protein
VVSLCFFTVFDPIAVDPVVPDRVAFNPVVADGWQAAASSETGSIFLRPMFSSSLVFLAQSNQLNKPKEKDLWKLPIKNPIRTGPA